MRPGWQIRQLGHLAAVPLTNGLGEAAQDGDAAWPRYIRTTDVDSLFALDESKRVTLPPDVAARAMLRRNDLLMCAAGSLGVSYLHDSDEAACFAGYLVRFRANPRLADPRFMAWWTQSKPHLDQIATGAVRSTIDNFSASKFRSMRIEVPPLPEQRAVTFYLDHETAEIDALVSAQEELIATLRERRTAVVEHALSATNAIWRPLRSFASFHNGDRGKAYPSREDFVPAGRPFVNAGHLSGGSVSAAEMNYISDDRASLLGGARLRRGDSLFCLRGSVGKHAFIDEPWLINALLASSLIAVRPSRRAVDPRFLFFLLGSSITKRGILEVATSTAQPNLGGDQLAEFRYPLPPLEEQRRIADYLDAKTAEIDALIAQTERFIALAKERRAAVITAAVTGQIDCTHLIEEAS